MQRQHTYEQKLIEDELGRNSSLPIYLPTEQYTTNVKSPYVYSNEKNIQIYFQFYSWRVSARSSNLVNTHSEIKRRDAVR